MRLHSFPSCRSSARSSQLALIGWLLLAAPSAFAQQSGAAPPQESAAAASESGPPGEAEPSTEVDAPSPSSEQNAGRPESESAQEEQATETGGEAPSETPGATAPAPGADDHDDASSSTAEPQAAAEPVEPAAPAPEEAEQPDKDLDFRTMLLVEAVAQYGGISQARPGSSLEDDDPDVESHRAGHLGGQATLGFMPGGSAFLMAGRLRGGSYLGKDVTRGNIAALMLFGANFARNGRGSEFTHVMGGFGVELVPGENQDLLTLNASGGTVVGGVSLGGGLMIAVNDQFGIAMLGMHIGWGQLY